LDPSGGSELTKSGEKYLERLLSEEGSELSAEAIVYRGFATKLFRLFIGYLHILTAIFWFGTILYVHLILKPAYAAHGLPKGELRVGIISMAIMGITGTILTLYRIPSLSVLFKSRFGILLLIKMILFLIMVLTALFVVFALGPKLKKTRSETPSRASGNLTMNDLGSFDGKEERASYIVYNSKVYDMTGSDFWKKGVHFERHKAGEDLSDKIDQAPHGEDKVLGMPMVGELISSHLIKRPIHEKVFYFLAYFNLGIVLLIALILALWRWW
jgi:predicted heme/steroid binding protein/uncharacterized membrane protein